MKVIMKDGLVKDFKFEEKEGKNAFRHTASHVLAQAVKRLYPTTKCAIGPVIEDGFYYDFEFDFEFTAANLVEIEQELRKFVKESLCLLRYTLYRVEELALLKEKYDPF